MELKLDTPATYRIRVKGYLDSSWSDRLSGLAISPSSHEHEPVVTTLYGQVLDQAALAGVLSALYSLHLPILSVECLSEVLQTSLSKEDEAKLKAAFGAEE